MLLGGSVFGRRFLTVRVHLACSIAKDDLGLLALLSLPLKCWDHGHYALFVVLFHLLS